LLGADELLDKRLQNILDIEAELAGAGQLRGLGER